MPWIVLGALLAAGFLTWSLVRRFGVDRLAKLNEQRRAGSRMVGRGELVDGSRHIPVALALTSTTFFYENAELRQSVDLQWVREIEYGTELLTGFMPANGKVLRIHTATQSIELVLPEDSVARWHMMLPPRRPLGAKLHVEGTAA